MLSTPTSKTFTYAGPLTTPPAFTTGTWNYPLEYGVNCISPGGCLFAANSIDASVSIASFAAAGSANSQETVAWATKGKYGWVLPSPDPDSFAAGVWDFAMCGGGTNLARPTAVRFPGVPNAKYFPGYQYNIPGYSTEGSELNFTRGAASLTWGDPVYVFLYLTVAAGPAATTLTFASVPSSVTSGMSVSMWGAPNLALGNVSGAPSATVVTLSGAIGTSLAVGARINFSRLGTTHYKTRFDGTSWRVEAT